MILAKMVYDDPVSYPITRPRLDNSWQTWDLAQKLAGFKSLPAYMKSEVVRDSGVGASWNRVLSLFCVATLFNFELTDFIKQTKETKCLNTLRKNSRSYNKALLATKGDLKNLDRFGLISQEFQHYSVKPFPKSVDDNDQPYLMIGQPILIYQPHAPSESVPITHIF